MTLDFSRVRFIMTEPSHPGNVGSAARAIKTMGFDELVLVAPKIPDITLEPDAKALASGASDVLERAQTYATLSQALEPVTLSFALTARARDLGPPVCDIRQAAQLARKHLHEHPEGRVAFVVGTERSGLTNEQVSLCHRACTIPANPLYSSLNVAQALQLGAFELRYALLGLEAGQSVSPLSRAAVMALAADPNNALDINALPEPSQPSGGRPASSQALQALLVHWQEALIAVEFLNPAHPKKLMPRMQHFFNRNHLTVDEVDMWRGVCTAMVDTARRAKPPS
jgi:tRNA/rRNA methyltransferase